MSVREVERDDGDLARRLRGVRARIVSTKRNSSGRIVHLLQFSSGEEYAMFHGDVMELAIGATTLHDILGRNVRADLEGPWPPLAQKPAPVAAPASQAAVGHGPEDFRATRADAWDASLSVIASMVSDYAAIGQPPADVTRPPGVRRRRAQ
jgi:hypothetical protein